MRPNRTTPHAVSQAGTNSYGYDCNGNMTSRNIGGQNYTLTYDEENRLTAVSGPGVSVSFSYDGDGNRVQADWFGSPDHTIIAYIGNTYEYQKVGTSNTTIRQYYYAGSTRIAMRQGSTLYWLFGDQLGSTSRVANADGTPYPNGEQGYKPWGEKRYPTGASGLPTTYRFTGERQEAGLGPSGGEGLYWVGSRWLDPELGRWIQPDVIVPEAVQGVQAWDRFAFVNNNPLRYVDPTGHKAEGAWSIGHTPPPPPPPRKPTPTPRPSLEDIFRPKPITTPRPGYYAGPTSTPTPTSTPEPEPLTLEDMEEAFDHFAEPDLSDFRWSKGLPGPYRTIGESIENGLAILWSIKEGIKGLANWVQETSVETPAVCVITPSPTPHLLTPTFTPFNLVSPTLTPYQTPIFTPFR